MATHEGHRLTRRDALRGLGLVGVGALAVPLLAACGGAAPAATAVPTTAAAAAKPTTAPAAESKPAAPTGTPTAAVKPALGGAATPTPGVEGKDPSGKKGEVTWLVRTDPVENKWQREIVVPDFQKANPGVTLNIIVSPWEQFDTKLFTLAAAGTPVDIWSHWARSGFGDFAYKGMLADLTPLITADKYDLTVFDAALLKIYTRQGKIMALPASTVGTCLFYNQDLLKAAGFDAPPLEWKSGWQWEQFVQIGQKLTKDYGAPTGVYGIDYSNSIQQLAYLGGGDAFLPEHYETGVAQTTKLDSPEVLEGVQARVDLLQKYKVSPDPQMSGALSSGGVDPFVAQRIGITINGGWLFRSYKTNVSKFKWSIGPDPILKGNKNVIYTDPWMLAAKSADPESGWKFIKYLEADGLTHFVSQTGVLPPQPAIMDVWLDAFSGPTSLSKDQLSTFNKGMLANGVESVNHLFVNYDEMSKAIDQAMADVWSGKTTPKEGLAQAKSQVDKVLASIK